MILAHSVKNSKKVSLNREWPILNDDDPIEWAAYAHKVKITTLPSNMATEINTDLWKKAK